MFPVKNCCFHRLYSGKTCSTIFCQVPNVLIGQHEYTPHAIRYYVTHIWNSDLAKIGAIHQMVWDVLPYVTKWIASSSPCFPMKHDTWCESTVCSFLLVWFKNMACRFQGGKCTVRINAGTENHKVWIEYQQVWHIQKLFNWRDFTLKICSK